MNHQPKTLIASGTKNGGRSVEPCLRAQMVRRKIEKIAAVTALAPNHNPLGRYTSCCVEDFTLLLSQITA